MWKVTRTGQETSETQLPMFGLVVERLTVTVFTLYAYPGIALEGKGKKNEKKTVICFLADVDYGIKIYEGDNLV